MMRVQIAKIRRSGVRTAWEIADDGSIIRRMHTLCLTFPKRFIDVAEIGTVWKVEGQIKTSTFKAGEHEITERYLKVKKAEFLRPSGELLVRWIASNIEGVGDVKASRLVRQFPDLDEKVRSRDVEALSSVAGISADSAQLIIKKWPSEGFYAALEWLQESKLPLSLAQSIARVYKNPVKTLSEDPLILTAFGVSLKDTLKLIERTKLDVPHSRILAAVAEQVAVKYCFETGSTVLPEQELLTLADKICSANNLESQDTVEAAALKHGSILPVDGGFQSLGAAIQERTVGRFLTKCNERSKGSGSLLAEWENDLTDERIEAALQSFKGSLPFRMTAEQREAVMGAVKSPVAIISGGAGTGKTTILLALLSIYDQLSTGLAQYQLALSGRAAQRMAESTGREAQTIAKFISDHLGEKKPQVEDHVLLVVDEASMVDLTSAYKIVGLLPYATRIIMVGDVSQLPPVGGGLIFHAAMDSALPVFELTQVKRQGDQSGIHQLATAIRNGRMDAKLLNSASGDTRYMPESSYDALLDEFKKTSNPADCIVLTPTRKGPLGVNEINKLIQAQYDEFEPQELHYKDPFMDWIPWITSSGSKLRLGDRIMVTRNDYEADIRNGDLGEITEVYDDPEDGAYGVMQIDGKLVDITDETINSIDLGYAITIHKSQGSQWPKCILMLPNYASRMTDQSLLYTAVTRPSQELVLMGDSDLIRSAITMGNSASTRMNNLLSSLPR